jgi:SAM-dependent methyltransferase
MAWYAEVFNQDYDRVYFPTFTPERNAAEADFIEAELHLPAKGKVLDLACGHGRHALELAKRGYRVTGLDIEARYIDMARQAAKEKDLANVEFILGDMRDSHFESWFDAGFCYFTSFGYFSDDDNMRVLEHTAKALVPGGHFLIETVNRDWTIHRVENQPRRWDEPEPDFFILEDISFNAHTSRIHTKRLIFDHGARRSVEYDIKLYTHAELDDMLEEAGLKVIATYGEKDRSPYAVSSHRMIIISQKI